MYRHLKSSRFLKCTPRRSYATLVIQTTPSGQHSLISADQDEQPQSQLVFRHRRLALLTSIRYLRSVRSTEYYTHGGKLLRACADQGCSGIPWIETTARRQISKSATNLNSSAANRRPCRSRGRHTSWKSRLLDIFPARHQNRVLRTWCSLSFDSRTEC